VTLLDWRDEYRIGVPDVDHEHRTLIGLINELHASLGTDRSIERVDAFLGEIYARISAHFALEERQMQASGYAQFAPHKADHERLLDDLRDIMDEVAARDVLDDETLSARLSAWFSEHFRTHDARLHDALAH
jgi:hemerythrin-like metal-binding protein